MKRLLVCFLTALCMGAAVAQSLLDPTRPPAQLGGVAGEAGTLDGAPQLQSVLISRQPGGRHVAVINGDTVRLGDSWNGARVARIAAGEVELVRGKEKQVLRLPSQAVDSAEQSVARLK